MVLMTSIDVDVVILSCKYYQFSIQINVDCMLVICSSFILHTIAFSFFSLLVLSSICFIGASGSSIVFQSFCVVDLAKYHWLTKYT
jgi:hypothetical protein